jgi:acetyltransferase-like isoleucine patch superfamily enzyme
MKHSLKFTSSAIVWVNRRRLRPFFCAGKLQPFLVQAPDLAALATAQSVVDGSVFVAEGRVNTPSTGRKLTGLPGNASRQSAGLWPALKQIGTRPWQGGYLVIIDASAPFLEPETLGELIGKLAKSDVAGMPDSGAAIAMTRDVFSWILRHGMGRSATDLADLYRLIQLEKPGHLILASPTTCASHEKPLGNVRSIYAGAREHQKGMALHLVDAGLGLRDPGRFDLRGKLTFGRDVFIDVGVVIIGDVTLEDGVSVGSNCILENCRIRAGSTIRDFSMVSGATVGAGCRIGPYARIRPDSILGRGCHIGNFVEIKKTTMGRSCKINHHSFVGDAVLGNGVILGAGSMTCNHDGSKVNRTRIHDGAYIGSGVMLVAPLTVGRNAFVGAGSTIVATAPANSLTLGRARQISIKGWVKKSQRKKNQNAKSKK